MLVTEPTHDLTDRVQATVDGGVNMVQLRGLRPCLSTSEAARAIRSISRGSAILIVNLDVGLALQCGAEGVHLPVRALGVGLVRRRLKNGLVGRSVHSVEQARFAESDGADYVIAGTIFKSSSHPDVEPQGLGFLEQVCTAIRIPVVAIGGVTPENATECILAGAVGVAVMSPLMRAADPREEAERYARALGMLPRRRRGTEK